MRSVSNLQVVKNPDRCRGTTTNGVKKRNQLGNVGHLDLTGLHDPIQNPKDQPSNQGNPASGINLTIGNNSDDNHNDRQRHPQAGETVPFPGSLRRPHQVDTDNVADGGNQVN